jgi:hypothetical protein
MVKTNKQSSRKIWQPLNRKSHILITIAALAVLLFQLYFWYARSLPAPTKQPQPTPPLPEQQNR